jgi:hypothetical protein
VGGFSGESKTGAAWTRCGLHQRGRRNSLWAANLEGKSLRIAMAEAIPYGIDAAASKACGKFPVPSGQGMCRADAGKFSKLAGNSQRRAENRRQRHDPMLAGHLLRL